MTDLASPRFAALICGTLLLAAIAMPASAQIRIDSDETGQIVAMSNLSTARGCAKASGRGRVVKRHYENGQIKGVTFKDTRYGESYLNLPDLGTVTPASARARVAQGFATLLVEGQELKVETLGCGAGGRIEKLATMALIDRPPPRRAAPAAALAPGPAPVPNDRVAATSSGTGIRAEDGDDSVLRAPDGPATASAGSPRVTPAPAPQAPPPRQAQPRPAEDEEAAWDFSTYARKAKLGIADGNHFTTLMFDCVRGSGRTTVLADDPRGKYRRGSRQTFSLTAGGAEVAITGKATYDEMNSAMQIEATIALEPLRDVLSEIARQSRFVIGISGRTQTVDVRGAGVAIPKFLAACARRR